MVFGIHNLFLVSEIPLILYDCQFDNVKWHWDKDCHRITLMQLQGQWAELAAK